MKKHKIGDMFVDCRVGDIWIIVNTIRYKEYWKYLCYPINSVAKNHTNKTSQHVVWYNSKTSQHVVWYNFFWADKIE